MPAESQFEVAVDDGVGVITLTRPERLNALTLELVDGLDEYLRSLPTSEVLVVILTGAGRGFCSGIDLKSGVGDTTDSQLADMMGRYELQTRFAGLVKTMRAIPQPLVAAIHGPAVGGGLSLAAACDIRIADQTALFSVAFLRVGLTGGDMGTSYFLPKTIPTSAASELLLTGRDFDAFEAFQLGFVSQLVAEGEALKAARELAGAIRQNSPLGIRLTKEAISRSVDGAGLEAALTLENRAQVMSMFTEPFEDALDAFRRRHAPKEGR